MNAVIIKAHGNYKVGDEWSGSGTDFEVLASEGYAVTAGEYRASQAVREQEERLVKARENKVDDAIKAGITAGRFLPKEDTTTVRATALAIEAGADGAGIAYIGSLPVKAHDKLQARQTEGGDGDGRGNVSSDIQLQRNGLKDNIKAYYQLSKPFATNRDNPGLIRATQGKTSDEAKEIMATAGKASFDRAIVMRDINEQVLRAGIDMKFSDVVRAADYADPAAGNPLGVLNTGLQLSWNFGFLANQLALINDITTDISNQPALFNQVLRSRYIIVPGVQNKTAGVAWRGTEGNTTDVNVTINQYVGVPITLSENIIGTTIRNLHMEQKTPQMYGLGEYLIYYIINALIAGTTRINNDGVTTKTATLQGKGDGITPGAKFVAPGGTYSLSTFTAGLPLNMDLSKFPGGDEGPGSPLQRFAWVHSSIYANIASDANLLLTQTIQSAINKGSMGDPVSTGLIPQLGNIKIRKSQLMTDTNTLASDGGTPAIQTVVPGNYTNATVRGIAGTRSSLIFASRIPVDYVKIMPEIPSTAAIEMVTEPNTGLTFMVVKYLDHGLENSNLRVQLMFGVGIGDERQAFLMA